MQPTPTVWLGPGLATGGASVVWNVDCNLEESNGILRSTWMVNVLLLVTRLAGGTGVKFRKPSPGNTRILNGSRLVSVAVTEARAFPVFTRSARYVTFDFVGVRICSFASW